MRALLLIAVAVLMLLDTLASAQKVISPAPNAPAAAPLQIPAPGAANPNSPTQAKPNGPDKGAEPDQRGTQESPFIVKISPTPKTEAETRQAEEERENKSAADWSMVRFTAILGFIGFLQLLAFGWQGWQLGRGVSVAGQAANEAKDAIKASQASAEAANRHARSAVEANRINRDFLIATQRPWVHVKEMTPAGPLEYTAIGVRLLMTCRLENIGHTPAIDVWPRVCGVLQQSSEYNARRQQELMAERDQSSSYRFGHAIFPGQDISVMMGILIKDEEIAAYQQDDFDRIMLQITTIGFVRYRFTFDAIWRYTGFSYGVYRRDTEAITGAGVGAHPTFYKDAGNIRAEDLTLRPWFADGECFFAT